MGIKLPGKLSFLVPSYKYTAISIVRMGVVLLLSLLLFQQNVTSATVTSGSNGNWNSAGLWIGGLVPEINDDVVVDSEVTIEAGTVVEINSLNFTNNGKLKVNGALVINGDMTMNNNGSELITGADASILIFGNALLDNKVTLDLSSYFIVMGDFTKTGSDNQGEIFVTGAHIYVFGTISSSWSDFTACPSGVYGGTTDSITVECDAGQYYDFIENVDPEDLPEDIYNRIVECDPVPTAVISGDAILCNDGSLATITVDFTGNSPWDISILKDGYSNINVTAISVNPYHFQVSVGGTYTLGSVKDAGCTGAVYGSAVVIINPLPDPGEIVFD